MSRHQNKHPQLQVYRKQKFPNSFFEWPFCERASQDAESSMISFQSWQKTLTVS